MFESEWHYQQTLLLIGSLARADCEYAHGLLHRVPQTEQEIKEKKRMQALLKLRASVSQSSVHSSSQVPKQSTPVTVPVPICHAKAKVAVAPRPPTVPPPKNAPRELTRHFGLFGKTRSKAKSISVKSKPKQPKPPVGPPPKSRPVQAKPMLKRQRTICLCRRVYIVQCRLDALYHEAPTR